VEDWTVCTYACMHLRWVSRWIRRLLVVTGARCPLTKSVVTAVEQQATTRPHCSRGVQSGGICEYVVQREPRRPVVQRGRKRFLCQLPLWFYLDPLSVVLVAILRVFAGYAAGARFLLTG
jgi:hypothetical protein